MFNLTFYKEKLQKLQQKNQRILQEYISNGLKFGQDIQELNQDMQETQKLVEENTPKEKEEKIVPIPKGERR